LIYLALDDGSRKKEGKIQRTREKKRNIINKKESKKDKTWKNLYPFIICVLLHTLVVLKERKKKHDKYQLCSLVYVTLYPHD
jgi:hypothetical protein